MKVKVVGLVKSKRIDKVTGELTASTQIYYNHMRELTGSDSSEASGVKADGIWTRLDVGEMKVGDIYDLETETREFGGKSTRVLVDFTPVTQRNE